MQLAPLLRQRPTLRRHLPIIGLWLLGWLAFAALAVLAAVFSRFPADLWLTHRIQEIDAAFLVEALDWAENFADRPLVLVPIFGTIIVLLLARRAELFLFLATPAAWLVFTLIRETVRRPRPELMDMANQETTFSFPSGHVTGTVVIDGLIFYLASVLIDRPLLRLPVQLASATVILLDALERIHSGAHWPSDVLGGLLLGGLIVATFIWVHRRLSAARFGSQ
jgi:undecaprenyl-diphosphatase